MTTCRECGGGVAGQARMCPSCGLLHPSEARRRARDNIQTLVVISVFATVLAIMYVLGG